MKAEKKTIFTIGHSNRSIEVFLELLQSFHIKTLVDVRQFPGSRKYPHFNKENLQQSLLKQHIQYIHMIELGGRRKLNKESLNSSWKHPAFRSYADYMETAEFRKAIQELEKIAAASVTAYMCSEALWWSCHRSMISDYLKSKGWQVMHIMNIGKATEHPYTSPARIVDGELTYRQLF